MRRWQRRAADPVNRPEVQEGKGAGVEEAHVAGAAGREAPLQVLLQRRAQVLHEGGENGERNPALEHGEGFLDSLSGDRKSVVWGKSVAVLDDLGARRILTKNKQTYNTCIIR